MPSKTLSFNHNHLTLFGKLDFNLTLFRKNLTRFWPLWTLPSFIGLLIPLYLVLQYIRNSPANIKPLEMTNMYYRAVIYIVPVVSLCYAVLCAMAVWSYLYNARSVSLMHVLPIRREGLFLTNFLSGMVMMLIPYVFTGAALILFALCVGAFDFTGTLVTILSVLGMSFFYFSTATAVAFITGNIFMLPLLYFVIHFLGPILELLLSLLGGNFLFGLRMDYTGAADFFSPTVYLTRHLRVVTESEKVAGTDNSWRYQLTKISLEAWQCILIYVLLGFVLLGIALALYQRRRSETAGEVVAVGWMRPVFQYAAAFMFVIGGGQVFYLLFWSNFQRGEYADVVPMMICMIIMGAIGYYAAVMMLARSLRVFDKQRAKGFLAVVAFVVILCLGLKFDVLGIARRVPELDQIETVYLRTMNNNYALYGDEDRDREIIERVRSLHQAILNDKPRQYNYDKYGFDQYNYNRYNYDYPVSYEDDPRVLARLTLEYRLKNGGCVNRYYDLLLYQSRMQEAETMDYELYHLIDSDEMKFRRLHLGDPHYKATNGYLSVVRNNSEMDLNSREVNALLEAVGRDAKNGAWETTWFKDEDNYMLYLGINFSNAPSYVRDELGMELEPGVELRYDYINIYIRPGMTETIACLKELHLIEDEDLLTSRQLEDYREWVKSGRKEPFVPKDYTNDDHSGLESGPDPGPREGNLNPEVTDSITLPGTLDDFRISERSEMVTESTSADIIGGADDSTTVFVTGTPRREMVTESSDIDIIGGADGPTTVFVTGTP